VYRNTPRSQTPTFYGRTNLFGTGMLRYAVIFHTTRSASSYRPPICSFECCRLALPCTWITIIERYRESIANTLLLSSQFSLKRKTPEFLRPGSLN